MLLVHVDCNFLFHLCRSIVHVSRHAFRNTKSQFTFNSWLKSATRHIFQLHISLENQRCSWTSQWSNNFIPPSHRILTKKVKPHGIPFSIDGRRLDTLKLLIAELSRDRYVDNSFPHFLNRFATNCKDYNDGVRSVSLCCSPARSSTREWWEWRVGDHYVGKHDAGRTAKTNIKAARANRFVVVLKYSTSTTNLWNNFATNVSTFSK